MLLPEVVLCQVSSSSGPDRTSRTANFCERKIILVDVLIYSRSVALEVVVDIYSDAGVRTLVRARERDFWRVGITAAGDLDLSTANVLASRNISEDIPWTTY